MCGMAVAKFLSDLWCLLVYGVVSLYSLACLLWLGSWFSNLVVPITVDYSPEWHHPPHLTSSPLLHNLLLLSLFPIQHSAMPRGAVKWILRSFVPERYYRAFYVLMASTILNTIFFCWQPMPAIVWEVPWPALENIIRGLHLLSCVGVAISLATLNPLELIGVWSPLLSVLGWFTLPLWLQNFIAKRSEPILVDTGIYGVVRHPVYSTTIMTMWITPTMTIGHLLIATVFTAYTVFAVVYYEEPDLVKHFGSDYLKYKEKVPCLFPVPSLFAEHKERLN